VKTLFITGAAHGIGLATAKHFAAQGWFIGLYDINSDALEALLASGEFPLLKQTPGATMVNLCSVSSIHGLPLLAVYSASKFYVNGLTEALAIEWAKYDIRVTAVKPPLVNTKMGHSVRPELMAKFSVDMEPEEVAAAIRRAAEGKRTGYLLGNTSRVWGWLDKFLPEAGRHRLVRYLTNH